MSVIVPGIVEEIDQWLGRALIKEGLRIGLEYQTDDGTVEYHFITEPFVKEGVAPGATCCMVRSNFNDPFRLCGMTLPLEDLDEYLSKPEKCSPAMVFKKVKSMIFPKTWDPGLMSHERLQESLKALAPAIERARKQSVAEREAGILREKERVESEMAAARALAMGQNVPPGVLMSYQGNGEKPPPYLGSTRGRGRGRPPNPR